MTSAPTKKPAAAKPAAAKPAAARPAAKAAVKPAGKPAAKAAPKTAAERAATPTPEVSKPAEGATLKPKDLIARVAESSGAKIKDVREAVIATLAELGKSLDAGEILALPPLGKLRITPSKAPGAAGVLKLKLQRAAGTKGAKKDSVEPLAEPGEAS